MMEKGFLAHKRERGEEKKKHREGETPQEREEREKSSKERGRRQRGGDSMRTRWQERERLLVSRMAREGERQKRFSCRVSEFLPHA